MTADVRSGLLILIPLAVVGIGLALVGTTTGATAPLTEPGPGASFMVSDGNVTFEQGDQAAIVLRDVQRVDRIEITRRDGGTFAVTTERDRPLTARERERARRIAVNNATVANAVNKPDAYDVSVEPIRQLTTESIETSPLTATNGSAVANVTVEAEGDGNVTVEKVNGRVTIDRTPTYVEDEAAVRFSDPSSGETRYTAIVDLANERVVDVTDWDEG